MWGEVSRRRKQHHGWDCMDLEPRPSDLKSNALTTTPLRPHSPSVPLLFPSSLSIIIMTVLLPLTPLPLPASLHHHYNSSQHHHY